MGAPIYDLFAIVCHVGGTERGHYTAFARDSKGEGAWRYADDGVVTFAREEDLVTERVASLAYLLFYVKRMDAARELPPAVLPPGARAHVPASLSTGPVVPTGVAAEQAARRQQQLLQQEQQERDSERNVQAQVDTTVAALFGTMIP